jgi:hypothetical protein
MPDPVGNRGPLGTRTNDPEVDEGTMALRQNRSPTSWGGPGNRPGDEDLEDELMLLGIAPPKSVGGAAADAARLVMTVELQQRADIHLFGEGTRSGSQSGDFSRAQIAKMSRGEAVRNAEGKVPINCTELPLMAVKEYFRSLGRADLGAAIEASSRDSRGRVRGAAGSGVESGRLTALIKELHDRGGFETTYLGLGRGAPLGQGFAEVSRRRAYPTAAKPIVGADTKTLIRDVRAPVDRIVVKHGNRKQRREFEQFMEALAGAELAIGTVDAGMHGFVIAAGKVYEVHWDANSRKSNLFQVSEVVRFLRRYQDALVAIPTRRP